VPSYIVAAEVAPEDAAPYAHAVADIGDLTHLHGVALCGFPAEHLTSVPGLKWEDVEDGRRCMHCLQESTTAGY
jgi:hypothetical protein